MIYGNTYIELIELHNNSKVESPWKKVAANK